MNTGTQCVPSTSGLLTTVAYQLGEGNTHSYHFFSQYPYHFLSHSLTPTLTHPLTLIYLYLLPSTSLQEGP